MDAAHTIVLTPVGTLLVWSNGADDLHARTLTASDKASWRYADVPAVHRVDETISVNGRNRTLRLHVATVERLQINAAQAAARDSAYTYQEEARWSHGRWGITERGLDLPGASDAAKDKVRMALLAFFAGWADTEQGRALLCLAEEQRLIALIVRLDHEAEQLELQAADLRAEQASARDTLARHRATAATAQQSQAGRSGVRSTAPSDASPSTGTLPMANHLVRADDHAGVLRHAAEVLPVQTAIVEAMRAGAEALETQAALREALDGELPEAIQDAIAWHRYEAGHAEGTARTTRQFQPEVADRWQTTARRHRLAVAALRAASGQRDTAVEGADG